MKDTTKAHLAVLGTNLFFAANFSLVKLLSPHFIGPFALNAIRAVFSALLFWAVWLFGKTGMGIRREHRWRMILCALTGVAINQMFFIKGLTLTSTIHASFLMLITPITVTVFAAWALQEKLTIPKGLGLALGIGGAGFLIVQKETSVNAPNYLLGDFFILINAVSYSLYFILVKPLMQHYTPLHIIRWIFTLGSLMILPFAWNQFFQVEWASFQPLQYLALLCIVITGTFLAYLFNAYGLQHIGAGKTGAYIYTQPLFAVVIATYFLNESMTWQKGLAAMLIIGGVLLVSLSKK